LTVGYQATLKRGYAVVRSGENVLTTRAAAAGAANLEIEFQDGRLALAPDKAKKSGNKPSAPEQGSLF
jgi:exodeoxyribonuclease VII large subunit